MKYKVKLWLRGLIGGAIGGGANAAVASLGLAGAESVGVKVQALDLTQLAAVFVSGFGVSILLYLKQSPLPPESTGDTKIFEKEIKDEPKN